MGAPSDPQTLRHAYENQVVSVWDQPEGLSLGTEGGISAGVRYRGRHVRDRTAARNLAILCKVAINLISHGRTAQISMRARRKQAAWNDEYMLSLRAG